MKRRHGQGVAAGLSVAFLLAGCSAAGQATDDAAQQGGAASSEDPAGVEPEPADTAPADTATVDTATAPAPATSARSDAGPATSAPPGETPGSAAAEPTDASRDELLSLNAEEGARADLREFRCGVRNGVWNAGGSVTNPSKEDQVYYVRIGIIESDESRSSIAFKNVVLDVPAGSTQEFTAEDIVTTQQEGLDCLPRVVRADGRP